MLETYPYESDFEDLLESDAGEDAFEDIESLDELAEWEERRGRSRARGRGRGQAVRTPPQGNAVARQAPAGFATKAELAATAKKLDARIATNSTAVKTLDGRTRVVEAENGRIGAALRKEIVTRKKVTTDLKRTLDETRQISMLMPLLSTPGSVTIGNVTHQVNEGDTFSKILPIMMFSGSSGSSGSGGGLFGGDSSGMMMAVLAIALSGGK